MSKIKIIECPRDAMQGMRDFVKTQFKIDYINSLLKCGFDTIDFGSFVSPKAIPQMKDTAEVLKGLELNNDTKLLAIVANERGATDAINFDEVNYRAPHSTIGAGGQHTVIRLPLIQHRFFNEGRSRAGLHASPTRYTV